MKKNLRRIAAAVAAATLLSTTSGISLLQNGYSSTPTSITASAANTSVAKVENINGKIFLSLNGIYYLVRQKAFPNDHGIVYIEKISGENVKFPRCIYTDDKNYKGYYDIEGIAGDSLYNSNKKRIKSVDFSNCTDLIKFSPEKLLDGCDSLTSVTFPSHLPFMSAYAFRGCKNLQNVNMNEATLIKALRLGCLGDCPSLTKINNETIVSTGRTGRPYFNANYEYYIKKYVNECDSYNVSFTNKFRDIYIKNVVKVETAGCTTDAQKIRKLHDWVCNNINYAYDSDDKPDNKAGTESTIFIQNKAICDGYARGFTLLLREAGIEAYYVLTKSHAWNIVKLGDRYFHIDTCHDGSGDNTNYSHYLKSTKELQLCECGHVDWNVNTPLNSKEIINYTIPKPDCDYSLGDANMDGRVNEKDDIYIRNILLKKESVKDPTLTDVNGDGVISMADSLMIPSLYLK